MGKHVYDTAEWEKGYADQWNRLTGSYVDPPNLKKTVGDLAKSSRASGASTASRDYARLVRNGRIKPHGG